MDEKGGKEDGRKPLLYSAVSFSDDDEEETYSINEYIEMFGFGMFQVKLTFVVGLSWMADAIAITLLAVLGPAVQCYWNLSSEATAMISTCLFCGMFFGCWFWGWFCDMFGRKPAIALAMMWIAICGVAGSFAPSHQWLLVAMTLEGFGIGGVGQSMTIYSEFLPKAHRAGGVVFVNIFYVLGNICSALSAYFAIPNYGWKVYLRTSTIPVFLFCFLLWWMPESPRFLVASSRLDEAMHGLQRVAEGNGKQTLPGKLRVTPEWKKKPRGRFLDLMNESNRRTTLILWFLWFSSIFAYYGVILFTAVLLNKSNENDSCGTAKIDASRFNSTSHAEPNMCHRMKPNDYIDYLYTATGEIPGLFLTFFLAERLGRRYMMSILFFCSTLCISLLHFCLNRVSLVALIFVLRVFISGIVQGVYLYTPEVYPTNIRAIGFGTCSGMARLGAILTPFVSQVLLETNRHLAVATYTGFMMACVGMSLLLTKETKGQLLTEDDDD